MMIIIVLICLIIISLFIQYIVILMGILGGDFKNKQSFRNHLIPFYWVYDTILTIKKNINELNERGY
jgi:hypothetical protein